MTKPKPQSSPASPLLQFVMTNVVPLRKPRHIEQAPALVPPASPLLHFAVETIREQTRLTNEEADELERYLAWIGAQ